VVDDGSGDGTSDFVRDLRNRRITLIRHERPKGVAAARNAGLDRARAPWIAFLDDDDLWAPSKLAMQLEAARKGAEWVCVAAVVVDEALGIVSCTKAPPEADRIPLLSYNCIPGGGSGPMVRTDVAREAEGFDTSFSILADWDMWIRLFLRSKPSFIDRPLVGYLRHNASMSHSNHGFRDELERIIAKHDDARRASGVEVSRDRWLKWAAAMQLRSGNRREALRLYVELARDYLDVKSIARAFAGALAPALVIRYWRWHLRRLIPRDFYAEAEAWLAPLRDTSPQGRVSAAA
jgi:glycosyltransferase involved in cell wall biosynthesis